MLKYKNNLTLSKGGLDIGLKVGILAEIGYMLQECAMMNFMTDVCLSNPSNWKTGVTKTAFIDVNFCIIPMLLPVHLNNK